MKFKIINTLVVVVFLTGCAAYNCEYSQNKVLNLIESSKQCESDDDCIILNDGICKGCYHVVSKIINQETYNNLLKKCDKNCPEIVFDCMPKPKKEEIICVENKCIDSRLKT